MLQGCSLAFLLIGTYFVCQILATSPPRNYIQDNPWTWVCREEHCTKIDATEVPPTETGRPLSVCKLNCGKFGSLWPKPTVKTEIGKGFMPFYPDNVKFEKITAPSPRTSTLLNGSIDIFMSYMLQSHPRYVDDGDPFPKNIDTDEVSKNRVKIDIAIVHPFEKLTLNTDEGYLLSVQKQDDGATVLVTIQANTYFGCRHALETLSQLIAYDETTNSLQIVDRAIIQDKPVFRYRGILLDTSRNYISVPKLRKLIDGMSYSKLNMFHWHITDTHSFPLYSKSVPQLTKYGAYSPTEIYTIEDIAGLIDYATVRGVKIVPEFDAPAHVGNGWQWGPAAGKGELAVCINQEPWPKYCVEPPCGQLNPVNENMYKVLGDVYKDMLDIFDNDVFHMGGDEVNLECWNSSSPIKEYLVNHNKDLSKESFIQLWGQFQRRALGLLKDRSKDPNITAVLWTSDLTSSEHIKEYLDKKDYVIQIWSEGKDKIIPYLIKEGYRVIFSNYDAWYFDCGYGGWVGGGPTNWCSPYKGWQQVYGNSPVEIYKNSTNATEAKRALERGQILGGEVAMWTEQADGSSVESKIWPRAAALGERLWTNPDTDWAAAEVRMISNRQRLVSRGLEPDQLQPEWCRQNEGKCYL